MKKNYLFGMLALAAMTMVGCSNDEVVNDYSQDNAIQFGTYVGRNASSRVSEITTDNLQSFGVFAFYKDNTATTEPTAPNFMNNQKVSRIEFDTDEHPLAYQTSWEYSPVKYWPNEKEDKIDFYAYAPHEEKEWDNASVKIAINQDATNQTDYLYATPIKGMTKQNVDQKVQFNFHHALSRVAFSVEAVIDEVNNQNNGAMPDEEKTMNEDFKATETTITVQEVELFGNFHSEGTLNLAEENNGVITPSTTATKWPSYKLGENDFTNAAKGVTIEPQKLSKDSEYLMIIPQKFENSDLISVRVKYTVTTKDDKLTGNDGASVIVNDITSDEFAFNFEMGKAYNFVLHLGLTSVKLSATVQGWDETTVVVNVPINEKSK